MSIIKGLSLWQPWASLMAIGAKRIETRSWSTNYRGLVAIHAAKRWNAELASVCQTGRFFGTLFSAGLIRAGMPRGCVVAIGQLHRVLSTTTHAAAIPSEEDDEFWFGDYSPDRFMWVFNGIWKLQEPVFVAGHQGLWDLSEGEADAVMAVLPDGVEDELLK